MRKNYLMPFASALLCMIACNKGMELPNEEPAGQGEKVITEVISAGLEVSNTKANVDGDLNFAWRNGAGSAGDYVAFWNGSTFVKSAASTTAGTSTTFELSYSGARSEYAYYPYYIVQDIATEVNGTGKLDAAGTTTVVLPDTYDIAEVSGTNTPCPMIAVNTPGDGWAFKQLCGLLRLTIKSIPEGTRKLTVKFNGNNVSGAFPVNDYGTDAPYLTSSRTLSDDIITINSGSDITTPITVNIPLPAGTYSDISVMAYDDDGDGTIAFVGNLRKGYTTQAIARKAVGARTITLNNNKFFSVSDKKYVLFAPGNLQAVFAEAGTSCIWKFAEPQYLIVGNNTANTKVSSGNVTEAGTVDLFGWVGKNSVMTTGWASYGITSNTNSSQYGNTANETLMHDWGELEIGTYVAGTYRTPTGGSEGEWYYLLISRSGAGFKYGFATVDTQTGVIILPDSFTDPKKNKGNSEFIPSVTDNFTENVYSEGENWNSMQSAGAIFLPFAGFRRPNNYTVDGVGLRGYYWSSTGNDVLTAYSAYFQFTSEENHGFNMTSDDNRRFGRAVRLIRDLN